MMSGMTDVAKAEVMVRMTFGPNQGIEFSPDGTLLAVCSAHHVEIADARRGRVLRLIRGHGGLVMDVAFSPDGAVIVTGSFDGTARTWEVATGRPLVTFAGHDKGIIGVAFSPDGKRVATASLDGTVRLWNAASGAMVLFIAGHFEGAQDVAFSPDATRLVTASTLSGLVWDAATGKGIASFGGHSDVVTSVAFSPDGALVVSTAVGETARIWDAATGRETVVLASHRETDTDALFVPDGTLIVTGERNGTCGCGTRPRASRAPGSSATTGWRRWRCRPTGRWSRRPPPSRPGDGRWRRASPTSPSTVATSTSGPSRSTRRGPASASRLPTRRRPSGTWRPAFRWPPWPGTAVPSPRSRFPPPPRPARSRSRPDRWIAPPGPGTR